MKFNNLLTYGLICALSLSQLGCKNEDSLASRIDDAPVVKIINEQEYKFEGNRVTQTSNDKDTIATYGVISDIHGESIKARLFAEEFRKRNVDGLIVPGDIPSNELLRYGKKDSKNDKEEIVDVLSAIAETGLPIFVIPGNHERKTDYETALAEVTNKYLNVIDMTKFRIFDGDDVDFVSLPGYQTFKIPGRQFIPDDGYWAKPDFIRETGQLRKNLDDSVVLITNGAGKTTGNGKVGPGTIYSGADVGDETTTEVMRENNIPFAVVGHIHEAGGLAATFDGTPLKQEEWAKQFTANFGTLENWKHLDGEIYNGMAGILTVNKDQAKFEMLYLK